MTKIYRMKVPEWREWRNNAFLLVRPDGSVLRDATAEEVKAMVPVDGCAITSARVHLGHVKIKEFGVDKVILHNPQGRIVGHVRAAPTADAARRSVRIGPSPAECQCLPWTGNPHQGTRHHHMCANDGRALPEEKSLSGLESEQNRLRVFRPTIADPATLPVVAVLDGQLSSTTVVPADYAPDLGVIDVQGPNSLPEIPPVDHGAGAQGAVIPSIPPLPEKHVMAPAATMDHVELLQQLSVPADEEDTSRTIPSPPSVEVHEELEETELSSHVLLSQVGRYARNAYPEEIVKAAAQEIPLIQVGGEHGDWFLVVAREELQKTG